MRSPVTLSGRERVVHAIVKEFFGNIGDIVFLPLVAIPIPASEEIEHAVKLICTDGLLLPHRTSFGGKSFGGEINCVQQSVT